MNAHICDRFQSIGSALRLGTFLSHHLTSKICRRLVAALPLQLCLASGFFLVFFNPAQTWAQHDSALYFPSHSEWEAVDPEAVGWDSKALDAALQLAGRRQSSGVVILHRGRIMAERYWNTDSFPSSYQRYRTGADAQGRAIEDVASAQKSLVAILTGLAHQKGLIELDDPISQYLGLGWSKANESQEKAISIRHLLSMSSGLGTDYSYQHPAGQKWLYNTPVYHRLMDVLVAASGMDRDEITRTWLSDALGMEYTRWTRRPWASADIAVGLSTSARELAKLGLFIQAGGQWQGKTILEEAFLHAMLQPSQDSNRSYGYLWWLNGYDAELNIRGEPQAPAWLIPDAPQDLVAMQGANDRKLYLVPSMDLVVVRLGFRGQAEGVNFNNAFWAELMKAAPQ